MNTNDTKNKRKDGKAGGRPGAGGIALLCVYYVAACCFIPAALYLNVNEFVINIGALVMCLLSVSVMAKAAGSWRNITGYAITVFILVFFFGAVLPVGLFAAFASATCIYALLLVKYPSPFWWGLPIIPFAASLFLAGNAAGVVASVATLPCALMLAYSAKKKLDRVGTVCRVSFGICAIIAISFLISVYSVYGKISLEAARTLIDELRAEVTSTLISATDRMADLMNSTDIPVGDLSAYVESTVSSVFNLLPAMIIVISNIISYIIHSLFLSIYSTTDEERKEMLPMLGFEMSLISAFVYLISLILAFVLVSDGLALWGAAAENIMLILAPGLIITALGALKMITAHKGPSCFGTLIYLLVIFMLLSFSIPAILITAAAGAVVIIISHFSKKKPSDNGNRS
ncbi:MAG: DUF2232 domain-containing protein [Clostridia bacterium]|nr:DUF2232 domain-containing protein [Clostridia bacterium]